MNANIQAAHDAYRKAATHLRDVVALEFPVGSIVEAKLGSATIRGRVVDHTSTWWYQPGTFQIRNLKTNKERVVDPRSKIQNVTLISLSESTQP